MTHPIGFNPAELVLQNTLLPAQSNQRLAMVIERIGQTPWHRTRLDHRQVRTDQTLSSALLTSKALGILGIHSPDIQKLYEETIKLMTEVKEGLHVLASQRLIDIYNGFGDRKNFDRPHFRLALELLKDNEIFFSDKGSYDPNAKCAGCSPFTKAFILEAGRTLYPFVPEQELVHLSGEDIDLMRVIVDEVKTSAQILLLNGEILQIEPPIQVWFAHFFPWFTFRRNSGSSIALNLHRKEWETLLSLALSTFKSKQVIANFLLIQSLNEPFNDLRKATSDLCSFIDHHISTEEAFKAFLQLLDAAKINSHLTEKELYTELEGFRLDPSEKDEEPIQLALERASERARQNNLLKEENFHTFLQFLDEQPPTPEAHMWIVLPGCKREHLEALQKKFPDDEIRKAIFVGESFLSTIFRNRSYDQHPFLSDTLKALVVVCPQNQREQLLFFDDDPTDSLPQNAEIVKTYIQLCIKYVGRQVVQLFSNLSYDHVFFTKETAIVQAVLDTLPGRLIPNLFGLHKSPPIPLWHHNWMDELSEAGEQNCINNLHLILHHFKVPNEVKKALLCGRNQGDHLTPVQSAISFQQWKLVEYLLQNSLQYLTEEEKTAYFQEVFKSICISKMPISLRWKYLSMILKNLSDGEQATVLTANLHILAVWISAIIEPIPTPLAFSLQQVISSLDNTAAKEKLTLILLTNAFPCLKLFIRRSQELNFYELLTDKWKKPTQLLDNIAALQRILAEKKTLYSMDGAFECSAPILTLLLVFSDVAQTGINYGNMLPVTKEELENLWFALSNLYWLPDSKRRINPNLSIEIKDYLNSLRSLSFTLSAADKLVMPEIEKFIRRFIHVIVSKMTHQELVKKLKDNGVFDLPVIQALLTPPKGSIDSLQTIKDGKAFEQFLNTAYEKGLANAPEIQEIAKGFELSEDETTYVDVRPYQELAMKAETMDAVNALIEKAKKDGVIEFLKVQEAIQYAQNQALMLDDFMATIFQDEPPKDNTETRKRKHSDD